MDTITHGIAGALIGKAIFRGEDMFAAHPMNRGRINHVVADARRHFSGFRCHPGFLFQR